MRQYRHTLQSYIIILALCTITISNIPIGYASEMDTIPLTQPDYRTFALQSVEKKLIHFSYPITPAYFRQNAARIEAENPYLDGITLSPGCCTMGLFDYTDWTTDPLYLHLEPLQNLDTGNLRYNFLVLPPFNDQTPRMSYWNDAQWEQILRNVTSVSEAVRDAGLSGIVFDLEHYTQGGGANPWDYAVMKEAPYTEAQTQNKVRQRAAQVMEAMLAVKPDMIIFNTYMFEYLPKDWNLADEWMNGWLDALGPQAMMIDGRETAYYWADSGKWFSSHRVEQFVDPVNLSKFREQVQVSRGIYAELAYHLYDWGDYTPPFNKLQQALRWEHNVYMSLATADEFVWLYADRLRLPGMERTGTGNAARNPLGGDLTTIYAPPDDPQWNGDVHTRIAYAKAKYANGDNLGWDIVGGDEANQPFNFSSSITAQITSPSYGQTFAAEDTITVTVATTGGDVRKVEFYQNAQKVGEDTTAPYQYTLTWQQLGDHTLIARALSTNNERSTSGPVVIHIQ